MWSQSTSASRAREDRRLRKTCQAAEKAIQSDPLLAEAHDALALACARNGQWEQADRRFRRAIELDPNASTAREHFAGWLLMPLGRTEEALRQLRVAEKADPLSSSVHGSLAFLLISAGRYEEAAQHCQKMSSAHPMKNQFLACARLGHGRFEEAIQLLAGNPNLGFLGYAYTRSGRREEAEKLAAASSPNQPGQQALIYAALGDKDRTFKALDRMAARLGVLRVGQYLTCPELALLRGDPRVKALRKKVRLAE